MLASGVWSVNLKILSGFKQSELHTSQELTYFKNKAICNIFLGMFKAAQGNLNKASALITSFVQKEEILEIYSWRAQLALFDGDLEKSAQLLEQADKIIESSLEGWARGFVLFGRGKLAMHQGNLNEAANIFTENILLIYEWKMSQYICRSLSYAYLGVVYLRQRNLAKAKITFVRLLKSARSGGLVRGQSVAMFGLGSVLTLSGQPEKAISYFGKAKALKGTTPMGIFDCCFDHMEFFYKIVTNDLDGADNFNVARLDFSKQSRLQSSYVVLDMLFISFKRRGISTIETIKGYFIIF